MYAADAVAIRTGALGRVRRKQLCVKKRLISRIDAGARVEHPQQIGQRRHAADRRPGGRRAALLLQGHRRRQPLDRIHLGNRHLVEKAPSVRRDGFEITPLGFCIQRPEGQRRLPGSGHAGKHDQRIAGNLERHVLEIVFAGPANPHEAVIGLHVPPGFTADQQLIHPTSSPRAQGASLSIRKVFEN